MARMSKAQRNIAQAMYENVLIALLCRRMKRPEAEEAAAEIMAEFDLELKGR